MSRKEWKDCAASMPSCKPPPRVVVCSPLGRRTGVWCRVPVLSVHNTAAATPAPEVRTCNTTTTPATSNINSSNSSNSTNSNINSGKGGGSLVVCLVCGQSFICCLLGALVPAVLCSVRGHRSRGHWHWCCSPHWYTRLEWMIAIWPQLEFIFVVYLSFLFSCSC